MTYAPHALAGWVPFVTPMPVWNLWPLLALPLVVGIAVVYKTTRVRRPADLWRESAVLSLYILGVMVLGGIVLSMFVEWMT